MAVRISFRTRLALAFVGLALATAALLLQLPWRRSKEAQLDGLRSLPLATARVAAGDVDATPMSAHRALGAQEIARGLLEDVKGFRGTAPQEDDITVVAAKLVEAGVPAGAAPTSRT